MKGDTVSAVKQGMKQVVTASATATRHFRPVTNLGITVGGKTGTAQVLPTESDNGLFICVAPLEEPQIAVACVIERSSGGSSVIPTPAAILTAFFTPAENAAN